MNFSKGLICLILTMSMFSIHSFGQSKGKKKKANKFFEKGKSAIQLGNLETGLPLIEKALQLYPDFKKANLYLANAYEKMGNLERAKDLYIHVAEIDTLENWRVDYAVGNIEHQLENYEEAVERYQKFLAYEKGSDNYRKTAEKKLKSAQFALEVIENPVPFNPINLGTQINSHSLEYLPSVTADESIMVYTRRIGSGQNEQEDFYVSFREDSTWSDAKTFGQINSRGNEGAQSISADGRIIFFASNGWKGSIGGFDIYYSYRDGANWSLPLNLGKPVNSNVWDSQPSISADGNTLFFASKREGGQGGIDIWMTELQEDKSWSVPVNLGPEINTEGDEQCPFIHSDGQTLYFSSDGHIGIGGPDLYMVKREKENSWGEVKNLGYPINTPHNENSLIVSPDGSTAYFSSDRFEGEGGLDLYSFELPVTAKPKPTTYVKGIVFDANKKVRKLLAKVELIDADKDSVINVIYTDEKSGGFLAVLPSGINYACNVSKDGFLFHSENFYLTDKNDSLSPYVLDIGLHAIKKPDKKTYTVGTKITLNNIFFDSGQDDILPSSTFELNRLVSLLNENPDMKIRINGHTDNVGDEASNQTLSLNRAQAVMNYLTSEGIAQSRLSAKGFGESNPIASNKDAEGRSLNRRTEFEIVD